MEHKRLVVFVDNHDNTCSGFICEDGCCGSTFEEFVEFSMMPHKEWYDVNYVGLDETALEELSKTVIDKISMQLNYNLTREEFNELWDLSSQWN